MDGLAEAEQEREDGEGEEGAGHAEREAQVFPEVSGGAWLHGGW